MAGALGPVLGQVRGDGAGALDVLRVAGVVGGDLPLDARVRGPVDVVRVRVEGWQPAGDQDLLEPFRGGGEVADGAEAAEGLAEDGPGRSAGEPRPDQLAVADDGVRTEVGEVGGLFARAAAQGQGLPVGRGGEAGAALVEQEHAEVAQGPAEPGFGADEAARAEAGAALQVDQPGQVVADAGGGDGFPAVDLDLLAAGVAVVEGHGEVPVGEDDSGLAVTAHGELLNPGYGPAGGAGRREVRAGAGRGPIGREAQSSTCPCHRSREGVPRTVPARVRSGRGAPSVQA